MKIFKEIVVQGFDRTKFTVNQIIVPSKDGTKIPLFIVARKGILMDGSHPCLLYAYGGFNISITPYFSVGRVVLSRHLGSIFCIANIRGGGEYGEEWHKAGSLAKKQNCFDDFISSAEFLISAGYTQPKKLCIEGGSNGGLLIGACINQMIPIVPYGGATLVEGHTLSSHGGVCIDMTLMKEKAPYVDKAEKMKSEYNKNLEAYNKK